MGLLICLCAYWLLLGVLGGFDLVRFVLGGLVCLIRVVISLG